MKKIFLFLFLASLFWPRPVAASDDYSIRSFDSQLTVNQDTSITIKETIEIEFHQQRHGIFRVIPIVYSVRGQTLKTDFDLLSVTNQQGDQIPFQVSREEQSVRIQIGDPDKTIIGEQTYQITYRVDRVLRQYEDHDEVYWNVTGSEWTTEIEQARATVSTEYANIKEIDCFAGQFKERQRNCSGEAAMKTAEFSAAQPIRPGEDFTIVVGFNKNNQFQFPGIWQRAWRLTRDNWGYGFGLFPVVFMAGVWWIKGRDKRYLTDNVYFPPDGEAGAPEDQRSKEVSPFHRPHLPMVYHPIDNLTPAQVGTIIDERVDIQDVVSEIVELARLGYLKIDRIEKKGLLGRDNYWLIKLKNADHQLTDYQQYLFEKLFKNNEGKIKISDLKNRFYQYLKTFEKKVYQSLVELKAFPGSPGKIRQRWTGLAISMVVVSLPFILRFISKTSNFGPLYLAIPGSILAIILARFMPRKTAWGYSLHRQTKGLKYYLGKGKWREEIAEKHLFLSEMLPLAISLGVVNKLAKDMADLGVEPPDYFGGLTTSNLSRNLAGFQSFAASNISSNPSGKSSWSGRSGFSSGGSSGGGFGGGGGGSW